MMKLYFASTVTGTVLGYLSFISASLGPVGGRAGRDADCIHCHHRTDREEQRQQVAGVVVALLVGDGC